MSNITKKLLVFALVAVMLTASVGAAAAKPNGNPKGEITAVDDAAGTLTLQTEYGEITVHLPEGFDYGSVETGQFVLVKGSWLNEFEIEAEWVKPVDEDDSENPEEPEEQEGEKSLSPWCNGQKEGVHPVVAKIAEKFGPKTEVTEEQVHTWFCEGYSVGQIMLALTTQIMDGSDPAETLAARKGGKGWGQIWKEKRLIGDEREGYPPGWANKPDKNGDKPVPPGLLKKTEQAETP